MQEMVIQLGESHIHLDLALIINSNLEEQARKNAERRLSHIVLPSEVNAACQSQTSLHSGAAAQALTTSREEMQGLHKSGGQFCKL